MNALEVRLVPASRIFDFSRPADHAGAELLKGFDEALPLIARARRRRDVGKRGQRLWQFSHPIENTLSRRGPHAWHELQETKTCHSIARVLREAQNRQHVFDMSGVEEFQATELDEGNVAPCEFDLKLTAVAGRPEKNCLLFQDSSRFAVLQHTISDVTSLVALVADADQQWPLCRLALRPEVLGKALQREPDDSIGRREDRLGR